MSNMRLPKKIFALLLVFSVLAAAPSFGATPEAVADIKPPIIKGVKFDGKTYFPGDIISAQVRLKALISDEGSGIASIEVWTNSKLLYSGGPGPFYDPATGNLEFMLSEPEKLSPGTYEVVIKAVDNSKNTAIETYTSLKVANKPVKLSGPFFSPVAFRPSTGEKLSFSFDVSVSCPLKVLIYSGGGDLIWSKDVFAFEGLNNQSWDGHNEWGKVFANGYYSLKIVSGNRVLGSGKFMIAD